MRRNQMSRKLALLAAVSASALLAAPLAAQAVQLTLGSIATGIQLQGGQPAAGDVTVTIGAAGITGNAFLEGLPTSPITGTYTLGMVTLQAGPISGEQYPTILQTPVSESFNYSDGTGNKLTGDIHWNFVQDNTNNPKFFGSMTITGSVGSSDFTGAFVVGSSGGIDFTASGIPGPPVGRTLDQVVQAGATVTVGISSGEAVPGPIVGAGLPGLVAACGGLVALGRRRRRKQTA
jgi:opacity protein-like surface antigen